ncbi:MAG: hypothetical protein U0324_31165 [Polyangiales bacterium]
MRPFVAPLVAALACTPAAPRASHRSAPPPPAAPPACVQTVAVTHRAFGYGGVGPSLPGDPPLFFGLRVEASATCALRGLRLTRVELLDAQGAVLASATGLLALRVETRPRGPGDYDDEGTVAFDGALSAGSTVRLLARERLAPGGTPTAVRYRATFVYEGGEARVEGPTEGPWPTA